MVARDKRNCGVIMKFYEILGTRVKRKKKRGGFVIWTLSGGYILLNRRASAKEIRNLGESNFYIFLFGFC